MEGSGPSVIVGLALIVTEIGCDVLAHVLLVLNTVMVALKVPGAAAAGTAMEMGEAGRATAVTSANPWASAAASKLIEY